VSHPPAPTPGLPPAIDLRDVTVVRGGHRVVDHLSTVVPAGTVVGLLGPSGCGKSTLMRSIVGVQRRVEGEITVLGRRAGDPWLRSHIGYRAQDLSLYEDLTVEQNIEYFSRLLGVGPERGRHLVDTVQLAAYSNHRVENLSGGQKARLSLITALLNDPPLLVLDEPTVGLDPLLRRELWQLFSTLADRGTTLLVSSHVMDEAGRCEWLLLMRDGRLLAAGTPRQLVADTAADTIEDAFLTLIDNRTER
jgi:ABC-2 type transport system ATP-binding protein